MDSLKQIIWTLTITKEAVVGIRNQRNMSNQVAKIIMEKNKRVINHL